MDRPIVFISYSHDSPEHTERVRGLAASLERDGCTCRLDIHKDTNEDWPAWMARQLMEANIVLCIVTKTYERRFRDQELPDVGLGVGWEAGLIRRLLYKEKLHNDRIFPVFFDATDRRHIPLELQGYDYFPLDEPSGYEPLLRSLLSRPLHKRLRPGPAPNLPTRTAAPLFLRPGEPAASEPGPRATRMVTPNMLHALAVGEMIEEFRIIRVLGTGGFGIVYECENTYLPETAAIKEFLPPELAYRGADGRVTPLSEQTEETFNWARDRFLQEAKTLWELASPERHPNIVRVTRYHEANGTAFMFMDFEQGHSLSEILEQQGRLSSEELEALFYPLLDGLERIHGAAILHRDIKPANILIRDDGTPVLIDFGAARHVVAGQERSIVASYTPVYAALEQYHEAGDQGPWTDIYSLGATFYQAVTGHKPLSAAERLCGEGQGSVAEECQGSYPQPILTAIDKALAIKPEERPQSVSEWRQYLVTPPDTSQTDEATVVRPVSDPDDPTRVSLPPEGAGSPTPIPSVVSEPATKKPGRRSADIRFAAGMAAVALMVSGSGLYFFRDALFPPSEPDPSQPEDRDTVSGKVSKTTISDADEPGSGTDTSDISTTRKSPETADRIADNTQPQDGPAQPLKPEPPPADNDDSDPIEEAGRKPDEQLRLAQVAQARAAEIPAQIIQYALSELGYYRGRMDGKIGLGSRRAIRDFQRAHGFPVTGSLDNRQKVALIETAAKAGHPHSQNTLGMMACSGIGVVKDEAAAIDWFVASAAQGNAYAAYNLGLVYRDGRGVEKSAAKARKYFEQARSGGYAQASAALEDLEKAP